MRKIYAKTAVPSLFVSRTKRKNILAHIGYGDKERILRLIVKNGIVKVLCINRVYGAKGFVTQIYPLRIHTHIDKIAICTSFIIAKCAKFIVFVKQSQRDFLIDTLIIDMP